MDKLEQQYTEDRVLTRAMVESTFRRDNVLEDLITEYFECYDRETDIGLRIAKWLDANRTEKDDTDE